MIRVNREALLHCLESVSPALSQREIVEQSNCFVFKKGEVFAFNDEIACRCESPLDTSFRGAVRAQKLLELLRKMPDEDLEFENQNNSKLLVRGKGGRRSGIVMEEKIMLLFNAVEKPEVWKPLDPEFSEAIEIVQNCAGRNESKFMLTCVHIHPKWVEASDDHQICRWYLKTGIKESTLVRQSSIKHICSLGMTQISETDSWIHFKNTSGLVFSCRRYMETYPDLSQYLKVEGEPAALPRGLVDATDIAQIFCEGDPDDKQVLIKLEEGRLKVKGEGVSGYYIEPKKIKYTGRPLSFLIPPKLLMDIVKRYKDCTISEEYLKVDGGSYVYISCLSPYIEDKSETNGHDTHEENGEVDPPKKRRREKQEVEE